ncbi:MAG TPA: DoxX family protein [Aeromicrobium sp.]|nr:DoxX family protein [Aeromicrobium sp.]
MNGTKVLAGMFTTSGVLHFVRPEPFEKIIPAPLVGYKKELVAVSGAAELACAALLMTPQTRRLGGLLSFGLLLGVWPANAQMTVSAYKNERAPSWYRIVTVLRLPLQIPMLRWAWSAWKPAPR